ncbi:Hpt domain-containing protein [Rhodobacteraceae bacterium LMO-12]|nr:Hpt domain-containing protein [Rhodobacteraceae bacterium LMO-JJ12]
MQATNDINLSVGLSRVRARFVDELKNRYSRLLQLRSQLSNDATSTDALIEIGQISHKIAGTAATLGFPQLGAEAAEIDDFITRNEVTADTLSSGIVPQIDHMNETINAVIQAD